MKLNLLTITASELQRLLSDGHITSLDLVRQYHDQILKHKDRLKAMISISPLPHLEKIAAKLDDERRRGVVRSVLHGIPFIVKVSVHECPPEIADGIERMLWIRRASSNSNLQMVGGRLWALSRERLLGLLGWRWMLD